MATMSEVEISLGLAFPKAGIVFAIKAGQPGGGSNGRAPSFHLSVFDSSGQRQIPFTEDASPQLADWVRGYTRWLYRAKVTASHDENGITGTFAADLSPEQMLEGIREACDMIRQRFDLYEESVLV